MALSSGGIAGEKPNPTNVGGQAVIEGVMMRAPGALSIVCRRRDGSLVVRERTVLAPATGIFKLPLFRGMHTLVSSLRLGHRALAWSAEMFEEDLDAEEQAAKGEAKRPASKPPLSSVLLLALKTQALNLAGPLLLTGDEDAASDGKKGGGLAMFIPIAFALFLFIALPQLAAEGLDSLFGLGLSVTSPGFQIMTGTAKLLIIVTYLSLIRLIPDVKRVFQYHGAEHKAISTYEAGQDLVVENARKTTALHARCGTTFIIMVAFVSVVVFSAAGAFLPPLPTENRIAQNLLFFLIKLPMLPVVAGITFELQRFFARYCTTGPLRVLLLPGFMVQKITTAEPDDDQLEVALASLRSALANAQVVLPEQHPDRRFESYDNLLSDPAYRAAT